MNQGEIELLRTDKKKGLSAVKKRIAGALKTPSYIDIQPSSVLIDGKHSIRFTIYSAYGRVEGEVTYVP